MNDRLRRIITCFLMCCMYLFAVSISIVGVTLPFVVSEYEVTLSRAGGVTVAQNSGGILALIFCGYLSDRYGKFKVTFCLFSLMGLGLLLALTISCFAGFAVLAFVLGLCSSSLNMVVSAYLADLYQERRDYYVNLGGVFFGIGSVSGTLYLLLMNQLSVPWRLKFGILGFACAAVLIVLAVALLTLRTGNRQKSTVKVSAAYPSFQWTLFRDKRLFIYAAIGFFYMSYSSAFMAWIPSYWTMYIRLSENTVSIMMTIYWLAILIGRIWYTILSMRIEPFHYLLWSNLIGGCAVLMLTLLQSNAAIAVTLVIAGVATGAGFQVCLAMTCRDFVRYSGTASSVVALCASCGGTFCCWATGMLAEKLGFFWGLLLIASCLYLAASITMIFRKSLLAKP